MPHRVTNGDGGGGGLGGLGGGGGGGPVIMKIPAAAINFRKSRLDTKGLLLAESPRLSSNTYPET